MILWECVANEWINVDRIRRIEFKETEQPFTSHMQRMMGHPKPGMAYLLTVEFLEGEPIKLTDPAEIRALAALLGIRDPTAPKTPEASLKDAQSP